jgi:DNA mismatch repair protein MutS
VAKKIVETPLMKQYIEMKQKHPDAILLFRVGDFYETFSDDAITASEILGITLTRRANGAATYVELAGFPHHALDTYLPKLVRAGKRVAICEQLEDPKLTKKLVKRGITELVTPGVSMNDNVLDHRENNFLAALHHSRQDNWGVAFLDISTGEFLTAEGTFDYVDKLMANFAPKEVLVERGTRRRIEEMLSGKYLTFELDDWVFTAEAALERLLKQFQTANLKGFGIDKMPDAIIASGAVMHYLDITNHTQTSHINSLTRIEESRYVRLDRFTIRNLELVAPLNEDGKSLLSVIDRTVTPMGARMMHSWVTMPLRDTKAINDRLDVVEYFFRNPEQRDTVRTQLEQVGDLGRLVSKIATLRITPREVLQVRNALEALVPIKALCSASGQHVLTAIGNQLNPCTPVAERIAREIHPDCPNRVGSGEVLRRGVNAELDELRDIAGSGKEYLMRVQARESEATGIPSLKIGFNSVFGYYIEVTNTHKDKVPAEWVRKQTLVNAERYITQELKEYEEKILGAQDKIASIETSLYNDLVAALSIYIPAMQLDARLLAQLDCLLSFTRIAAENHYCRPIVDDSLAIELVEARHPVIEKQLPPGEPYISNTVSLNNESTQILMLTGPNMSGKSALLRQTALNVLMAQIGCYVAADSAHIGYVDKIFTRVGASDNISLGESTFMVEMTEAASIINNMSERSLILFDELGRGTSTYDGISIAWAIVEHIHNHRRFHPKTLFATHYHELNEMEKSYERIVNYHVSVKEVNGKVVFLRKLARGGSEHSFGIHVARLAGMPQSIVKQAEHILDRLEHEHNPADEAATLGNVATQHQDGVQLSFFQLDDPVLSQVRDQIIGLDINNLTPMEALNKLHDIRTIITGKA